MTDPADERTHTPCDRADDRPDERPRTTTHDRSMNDPTTMDDSTKHGTTNDPAEAPGTDDRTTDDGAWFNRLSAADLRGLLDRIALAALVLVVLIAGWNAYGYVGTAIRTWLDPAYQPVALAAFNLAVLLVAMAGVIHQLRRLRGNEDRTAGSADGPGSAEYAE